MAAGNVLKNNFSVLSKHEAFFTGGKVQISKNGLQMFCSCGNQIKVLNVKTGSVVRSLGNEELSTFVCSSNDETLVTASCNGLLRQWTIETGQCERTWKCLHKGPVTCLVFDETSTLLATGGSDATIKIWDIVKQYCTHNLKGSQGVLNVVAFHPQTNRFLIFGAGGDSCLRAWDLRTSRCVAAMEGHYSTVTSLCFTPDGNNLLSCGRDKVVIYWDVNTFKALKTIPTYEVLQGVVLLPKNMSYANLPVDREDKYFITAGSKGVLRTWNLTTGSVVHTHDPHVADVSLLNDDSNVPLILQMEIVPSLNSFALVTHDHNIFFIQINDLTLQKQLIGYNDEILDVKFCGQDDSHLAIATNSCDIRLLEIDSAACTLLKGHKDIVLGLSVFPSNPFVIASCSKDNTIRLWLVAENGQSATCVAVGTGHTQSVSSIATSQLGKNFVVSCSHDTTLKLWEIPDVLNNENPMNVLQSRFTQIAHTKIINSVAISPNDKLIATGSQDKTAKLWTTDEGKFLGSCHGHRRGVWCVEFSPVDQVMATSSADGTVKIWRIVDFACLKTFEGHDCSVLKVIFISKGLQLLTSDVGGLMKLWTIATNECVRTFDQHSSEIWAVVANKKEEVVATGGNDSTIIVWRDVTQEEKQEAIVKENTMIMQEQKLSNLLKAKKFTKALKLSLVLEMPSKSLNIIREILRGTDGISQLNETLKDFREDQLANLLRFASVWNTNSKNCYEAQQVINCILKRHTPQELLNFPNSKTMIEGLIPYTERHVNRLERLMQQATFLQYTWQCMKLKSEPL